MSLGLFFSGPNTSKATVSTDSALQELLHPSCVLYLLSTGRNPVWRTIILSVRSHVFLRWSTRWSCGWCSTMRARISIGQGGHLWRAGDAKIKDPVGRAEGSEAKLNQMEKGRLTGFTSFCFSDRWIEKWQLLYRLGCHWSFSQQKQAKLNVDQR